MSCSTGGGHDSAAKAVAEEMERRGHRTVFLNPYKLKSDKLAKRIDNSYVSIARSAPNLFGFVYTLGNAYRRLPFRSPVYYVNKGMNNTLQQYLEENHFDIIITSHIFPGEILTNMKQHGISVPKMIHIATDYVCIPFTEEADCDAYIIPNEDLADDFVSRGISRDKLVPLGIPTSKKFSEQENKSDVKKCLGLEPDKQYILVSGGSMGGGNIKKAICKLQRFFELYKNIELIIICGSNKQLYEDLIAQNNINIRVVGYTDDMASYIKASDLFITKPGGLSSTEAAVCGVPIWHTSPIPGCETYNARYFSERGMSISGDVSDDVLQKVLKLLSDKKLSAEMTDNQKKYVNPNAAADICDYAEKLAE